MSAEDLALKAEKLLRSRTDGLVAQWVPELVQMWLHSPPSAGGSFDAFVEECLDDPAAAWLKRPHIGFLPLDESAIEATTVVDNRWYRLHRGPANSISAERVAELPVPPAVARELRELREEGRALREALRDERNTKAKRAFRSGARVLANAKSLRTHLEKFIAQQAEVPG